MSSLLRRFIAANGEVCRVVERRLPQARIDLQEQYEHTVARYVNSFEGMATVADVGGGKRCHFARHRRRGSLVKIVAVDISEDELAENRDVDEKRVADVSRGMPFADDDLDLIVSRSVLEHLPDVDSFFESSARVLKPGAYFIHVFPSKFALYAIANQLLPHRVSKLLLRTFLPTSRGNLGFRAYYDKTYAASIRSLLARHGFDVVELRVSYYQSEYFAFFVPLYVLSALYELAVHALGAENLAATILVVARKR